MTHETKGPGRAGVLLPLKVERSLGRLARAAPEEAAVVRAHMEALATGVAPSAALRIFPSARAFVAKAAVRGNAVLSVGRNLAQRCSRGCGQGAMVLLVDAYPVALFNECEAHAQAGAQGPMVVTDSQATS